jgi:hypothetical protein
MDDRPSQTYGSCSYVLVRIGKRDERPDGASTVVGKKGKRVGRQRGAVVSERKERTRTRTSKYSRDAAIRHRHLEKYWASLCAFSQRVL